MSRKPYKKRVSYSNTPVTNNTIILEEVEEAPKSIPSQVIEFQVQVEHPSLRRRGGPSSSREVVGYITDKGRYNIYAVENGWGKLEDGSWIMLQYTSKIKK